MCEQSCSLSSGKTYLARYARTIPIAEIQSFLKRVMREENRYPENVPSENLANVNVEIRGNASENF